MKPLHQTPKKMVAILLSTTLAMPTSGIAFADVASNSAEPSSAPASSANVTAVDVANPSAQETQIQESKELTLSQSGEEHTFVPLSDITGDTQAEKVVQFLYTNILDRLPSEDEIDGRAASISTGSWHPADMACDMFASQEFSNLQLDNSEIVARMYEVLLGRTADESEISYWASVMASGNAIGQTAQAIRNSEECLSGWLGANVGSDSYVALPTATATAQKTTSYNKDGATYLFMPSFAKAETTVLQLTSSAGDMYLNNQVVDGSTTCLVSDLATYDSDASAYAIPRTMENGIELDPLYVMYSENIDAMYLTSDDAENYGRAYIESSSNHSTQTTGSMVLVKSDGTSIYDGKLTQIKGRGNSSWAYHSKKPYQIKLDKKTDLLETGDKSNKAKTWTLIADALDSSAMRNTVAYGLAQDLSVDSSVEYKPIDLYYDGEYRGTYLLCEKVQVGSGRVEITDSDDANDEANGGSIDSATMVKGVNSYGNEVNYAQGLNNPDDITGGYLVEMSGLTDDTESWFYVKTPSGNIRFAVKTPEDCTFEEIDYISCLFQDIVDCLGNNGVCLRTGKRISEYLDLDSFAKYYWINEALKCSDGFNINSTYFYKDSGEDTLVKSGPAWDYDMSQGNTHVGSSARNDAAGYWTSQSLLGSIFAQCDEAMNAVHQKSNSALSAMANLFIAGNKHSFDYEQSQIQASSKMNDILWWDQAHSSGYDRESEFTSTMDASDNLKRWLSLRYQWLSDSVVSSDEPYTHFSLLSGSSWIGSDASGEASATSGVSGIRATAYKANSSEEAGSLRFNIHVLGGSWLYDTQDTSTWAKDTVITPSGATIDAIQVSFDDTASTAYDVRYRVASEDGWQSWCINGGIASTYGSEIVRIQIDTTQKGSSASAVGYGKGAEGFIDYVYRTALGRTASYPEVSGWLIQLSSSLSAIQFVDAVFSSEEFRMRNLSASDTVKAVYRAMGHTFPTLSDLAKWTAKFESGASVRALIAELQSKPGQGDVLGANNLYQLWMLKAGTEIYDAEPGYVYRLYNGTEHLYTTDFNEATVLYNSYGWGFEGVSWQQGAPGTYISRLYNPTTNQHLYTSDSNEITVLTTQNGWQLEGATLVSGGNIPVYRAYNPKTGEHHLTTDLGEYQALTNNLGWSADNDGQPVLYAQATGIPYKETHYSPMSMSE